jgi:hypothetical protein
MQWRGIRGREKHTLGDAKPNDGPMDNPSRHQAN